MAGRRNRICALYRTNTPQTVTHMTPSRLAGIFLFSLFLFGKVAIGHCGAAAPSLSMGQVVYTPIYSHIYSGNKETPFNLTATLSIRNTDPRQAITLTSLEYHDSAGKLLEQHISAPITLAPLAATRYVIREADTSGGSGASFIATWKAQQLVSPPLFESVMIGTQLQQGISFTSRGLVISETRN